MNRQETLALAVTASKEMFMMFMTGFNDDNHTKQADYIPNHVAWTLGHCAMYMQKAIEHIQDGYSLPETDFVTGDGTSGTKTHFDTESICFGSTPEDNPALYPGYDRAVDIFCNAAQSLSDAITKADDQCLDKDVNWGMGSIKFYALLQRLSFHNSNHSGQITNLRRALDLGSIIK